MSLRRCTICGESEVTADLTDECLCHGCRTASLPEPCRPDTNAQTDPEYPKTVNDVLHLLSCYWVDFLPDDVELGDEYYAAWERQARPLIKRIMRRE